MRKLTILLIMLFTFSFPVSASELTAPVPPENAQDLMPVEQNSFGEDLWYVIRSAFDALAPEITACCGICLGISAVVLLTTVFESLPGNSKNTAELVCTIAIGTMVFKTANGLILDGANTVRQLSDYGKLLLPVMATATAAQGGITTSTALYTGTAVFDALLSGLITNILIPLIYVYLALAVANSALGETLLHKLLELVKWLSSWSLKTILYIFTGYITITGILSGTADQSALKAAKLTISGMVPVVGGILSDASEAILVGAGAVKNTVGIYGLLAVLAITIGPFLKIGIQYLLLKLTAAVCAVFGSKRSSELIGDLSTAMGLLLAMTGTVCLLFLISMVCFMKGVT